eukprot:5375494-Prorocentrum_lima.AAC.1
MLPCTPGGEFGCVTDQFPPTTATSLPYGVAVRPLVNVYAAFRGLARTHGSSILLQSNHE